MMFTAILYQLCDSSTNELSQRDYLTGSNTTYRSRRVNSSLIHPRRPLRSVAASGVENWAKRREAAGCRYNCVNITSEFAVSSIGEENPVVDRLEGLLCVEDMLFELEKERKIDTA
jgi:hypothetical protein